MEFTKDINFNTNPTTNEFLTISYNGFLKNSANLWLRFGFGENWENTNEIKMSKTDDVFVTDIKLENFDTFNFCFKNENGQWDNNSNCNYITPIAPASTSEVNVQEIETLFDELLTSTNKAEVIQTFDIDALIEEILQPVTIKQEIEVDNSPIEIESTPIDLGIQISDALSKIPDATGDLPSYSSLDEILSANVITESPIELFEEPISEELFEDETIKFENSEIIEDVKEDTNTETALVNVDDPFSISPRELSKFYLIRKKIKLAFYKAFVKIPRLIFGTQED